MIFQLNLLGAALGDDGMPIAGVSLEEKQKLLGEMIRGLEGLPRGRLSLLIEFAREDDGVKFPHEFADAVNRRLPGLIDTGEGEVTANFGDFARAMGAPMILGSVLSMWGANGEQLVAVEEWCEELECTVRVRGADQWGRIDVTFGTPSSPAIPSASVVEFAKALPAGESEVSFRANLAPLVEKFLESDAMWNEWQESELGMRATAADTSGLFSSLQFMCDRLRPYGSPLVGSIDVGPKTEIAIRRQVVAPRGIDLRGSSLAGAIPSDVAFWFLDGRDSFAGAFFGNLLDAEGRFEMRSFLDEAVFAQLDEYYALFGPARKIFEAAATEMPPGYGFVLDHAHPHDVVVTLGEAGRENGLVATGLPVPGMAWLVRSEDFVRDRARFDRLFELMTRALIGGGDESVNSPLSKVELGLGVPTLELDIEAIAGKFGIESSVDLGGFLPHVCTVEDLVLFSTRSELSRRIITSANDPASSLIDGKGRVARAWNDPMPLVLRWLGDLSGWFTKIEGGDAILAGIDSGDREELPTGMAQMARSVATELGIELARVSMAPVREVTIDGVEELRYSVTVQSSTRKVSVADDPPRLQKKRALRQGLRYLARQQKEEGRWSDGGVSGLSDLALTSLVACVFRDQWTTTIRDPQLRDVDTRALEWIVAQQASDGPHAGVFGDPASPTMRRDQAFALHALCMTSPAGMETAFEGFDRAVDGLEPMFEAPMTLDEAVWWDAVSFTRVSFKLDDDRRDLLNRAQARLDHACRTAVENASAEEKEGALAFMLTHDPFGEEDRFEEVSELLPSDILTRNRTDLSPLGLYVLSRRLDDPNVTWDRSWISAFAVDQRAADSENAGSWAPLAAPFGSDLAATAIVLNILEKLQVEPLRMPPVFDK